MKKLIFSVTILLALVLAGCSDDDDPKSFEAAQNEAAQAGFSFTSGTTDSNCYYIDTVYYSEVPQNDPALDRAIAVIDQLKQVYARQTCIVNEEATLELLDRVINLMNECKATIRQGYNCW